LEGVDQWEQNMLAVGPSTIPWSGGNSKGLFTTVDVAKDTILCIKKGLLLNDAFWSISEYKTSDIRLITMADMNKLTNQPYSCILDKDDSISYSDFVKDPLDPKLVNAEFVELVDGGLIVLKCTKPRKAYSEFFVSIGKKYWIAEFKSYDWSLASSMNYEILKKAMSMYQITKGEIIRSVADYKISPIIKNYISSHMNWENSEIYSYMNVLVWKKNSCYINSVLQCLARIPALTQLLLNTDLFQNMDESTFLYNYITLLKLMTERKQKEATMKKYNNLILDRRGELSSTFTPNGDGDVSELFLQLLDKFCEENPIFSLVKFHLFGFYRKTGRYCSNDHHSSILELLCLLPIPLEDIKANSNDISLYSGIIQAMKPKDINRKCPYCISESREYRSYETFKLLHLPNIFVIQLQRSTVENFHKDPTPIHYEKYMTLPEGDSEVHYELIGLITHDGKAFSAHYKSYVLNPKNEWWLLDDLPRGLGESTKDPLHVTAEEVYSQKSFANLFFYRKISDRLLNNKIIDMVLECYGENKDDVSNEPNSEFNKVAVALSFPIDKNTPGVVSEECFEIIRHYKSSNIKDLVEFQAFLITHNLNLHFWRKVIDKKKKNVKPVEDNGTSGYQVDFLLHERDRKKNKNYWENDQYLKKNYTINEKEFLCYFDNVLNNANYFDDIKKPSTLNKTYVGDNEIFQDYDQWIYSRIKKYKSNEITKASYDKELTYYRIHNFSEWIQTQKSAMFITTFPCIKKINDIHIKCSFNIFDFQYTKGTCSYSIFMNTEKQLLHIRNFHILCYSSNCNGEKLEYSFIDLVFTAGNLNHISYEKDLQQYFLLPTFPFHNSFKEAVNNLIKHMNYILEYEELPSKFLDEPLQRWGATSKGSSPIRSSYKEIDDQTEFKNNSVIICISDIEKIENNIRGIIDRILNDNMINDKSVIETLSAEMVPIQNDNLKLEELEMEWEIFEMLLFDLKTILKNKEYNNNDDDIKSVNLIYNGIKQLFDEYSGIFQNDSTLEPISRTIIDLTQSDDDNDDLTSAASPIKISPGQKRKGKRKWIHVVNHK